MHVYTYTYLYLCVYIDWDKQKLYNMACIFFWPFHNVMKKQKSSGVVRYCQEPSVLFDTLVLKLCLIQELSFNETFVHYTAICFLACV